MDSTKSFIKVYGVTPREAEDFEFDYDTETSDILQQLVPNNDDWGGIGWIEFEEYEYNPHRETMHLVLETKWEPPTVWLQNASGATHYFKDKLVTMATIQKDETCATGVAVKNGEALQNKIIFEMTSEEVGAYYDEDTGEGIDLLDNKIWDSIGHFLNVCEQFYLGKD